MGTSSTLSQEEIRQIRYLATYTNIAQTALAHHYCVSTPTISRLISLAVCAEVDGDPEDLEAVDRVIKQYVDWRPCPGK